MSSVEKDNSTNVEQVDTSSNKLKVKKSKPKKLNPEEDLEYKELIGKIKELYGYLDPYFFKQIKDLKSKGVTYKQQKYVLWYLADIKKTFSTEYGLGQIQYGYKEAREYAFGLSKQEQKIQEVSNKLENQGGVLGDTVYATYRPSKNRKRLTFNIDEVLDYFDDK